MTKLEFEHLTLDQQFAEINDALLGGTMTAEEKRYFESKTIDQQLAEIWDAASNISSGGSGDVATDTIWDAAGDLAVGSGANTAARLAKGSALQVLRVNAAGTALEYATPIVTAAQIAALDLSTLPTSDPGSGKIWLNGGVLQVGA